MLHWTKSLVLAAGAVILCSGAVAAPILTYSFNVNRFECVGMWTADCHVESTYKSELNSQTISVTSYAAASGVAGLTIEMPGGGSPVFIANDGIADMDLFPKPVELDPDDYVIGFSWPEYLYASLAIGPKLSGSISHTDSSSTVVMTTGSLAGPAHLGEMFTPSHPLEWVGYVTSDRLNSTWLRFTGEWVQVNTVPEPGTIMLMLVALAGVGVALKRQKGLRTELAI